MCLSQIVCDDEAIVSAFLRVQLVRFGEEGVVSIEIGLAYTNGYQSNFHNRCLEKIEKKISTHLSIFKSEIEQPQNKMVKTKPVPTPTTHKFDSCRSGNRYSLNITGRPGKRSSKCEHSRPVRITPISAFNTKGVLMVFGELSYEAYQQMMSGVTDMETITQTLLRDRIVERLIDVIIARFF